MVVSAGNQGLNMKRAKLYPQARKQRPTKCHPPALPFESPDSFRYRPPPTLLPLPQAYAAQHDNMLVVGATDMFDDHVSYSNFDTKVCPWAGQAGPARAWLGGGQRLRCWCPPLSLPSTPA